MKVQHVELVGALEHTLDHRHVQRIGIADGPVEPQGPRPDGVELGSGHRIAAGEQRHVVPQRHQLLGQPRHDALGAAVELRRGRFGQRGDLCDAHINRHSPDGL